MSEILLGVRVPAELKELVDADRRTNQDIVQAALWREFGGERVGPIERRLEEKKNRLRQIESEMSEREREKREMREEIAALQTKLDQMESEEAREERRIQETVDKLAGVEERHLGVDEPPISTNADELDLSPDDLLSRVLEAKDAR